MTQVLLIHGAGSNAGYWRYVTPRLQAAGHSVVDARLPTTDHEADFHAYADAALVDVDRGRPVTVIAQSMGAFTAALIPDRTSTEAIVLVAPMIPAPGETPGDWGANVGAQAAQDEAAAAGGYPPGFDLMRTFFHDVPADVVEQVFAEGEPPQADEIFQAPCAVSRWPEVSTTVVACTEDRLFPLALVTRLARERLGVGVEPLTSGHLPALAHPDELSALLLRHLPPS